MIRLVYLAGPGVFLPNPRAYGEAKKRLCEEFGFEGLFPMDVELQLEGLRPDEQGMRISQGNEDLMRKCDFAIADLTPYRGISADVGTCYEVGFLRGLPRPVFAYSNDSRKFFARLQVARGTHAELEKGLANSIGGKLVRVSSSRGDL